MAGKIIKDSVLNAAREMRVGDVLEFPKERTPYIKSIASGFGVLWDKKFSTEVDKGSGTVRLRRIA